MEKISYQINWRAFKGGASFFIPCLDTAKAKEEMSPVFKRLKLKVLIKVCIEDGIRGLRVWRV